MADEPVGQTPSREVEPQIEMAVDPRAAGQSVHQLTFYVVAPGEEAEVVLGYVYAFVGERGLAAV